MTNLQTPSPHDAERFDREVEHGKYLAASTTERLWGWGTPAGQARAERRATLLMRAADLKPGMNVLEVGCGTGMFTQKFAASGCRLTAVDLSPDLLSQARERAYPLNNVSFKQKPFEECRDIGPFDAIIGSSVLHHLNMERALRNVRDLLKGGGRMAFAEPNYLNPQVFLERTFRRCFPYVSPDETAFVRATLARDLAAAGFDDIRIVPFDWLHPSTPRALMPVVSTIGRTLEHIPGIREFAGSLIMSARRV